METSEFLLCILFLHIDEFSSRHTLFSLRFLNAFVSTVMTVLGHEIMHTSEFLLGTLNVEKFYKI
jgi:hypothetical protein